MKLPESTATTRSAGSRSSRSRVRVRGSMQAARRSRSSYGTLAPAGDPRRDPAPDLVGAIAGCRGVRQPIGEGAGGERRRRRGRRRSARRCAPSASTVSSTWTTVAPGAISVPWRIVHMFRAQPHPTMRSAPRISSAAGGEAKPPETSSDQWVVVEQALGHGRRPPAAHRRRAATSRSSATERRGAPRPATNTGRCGRAAPRWPAARRRPIGRASLPARVALGRSAAASTGRAGRDLLGLHRQRQVEQDGTTAWSPPARRPRTARLDGRPRALSTRTRHRARPHAPAPAGRRRSWTAARSPRPRRRPAGCGSWRPRRGRSSRWSARSPGAR